MTLANVIEPEDGYYRSCLRCLHKQVQQTSCRRNLSGSLTLDQFLGPIIISDVFRIDGRQDDDYEWLWTCADISDTEPESAFVLFDPKDDACGFYTDGQCWIDPEHRGKGLSIPLILAAVEYLGGSPTNNSQGLGFSRAGAAAHKAAHRHAVKAALKAGLAVPANVLASQRIRKPRSK